MAKLIAHSPPRVKLRTTGFMGEPDGNIDITENGIHNVKPFATATVDVPPEIPIDDSSDKPLALTVDQNGLAFNDAVGAESNVAFGRNQNGIYATTQEEAESNIDNIYVAEKSQLEAQNELLAQYNQRLQTANGTLTNLADLASRKQTKIVTPTTSQQTVYPDNGYSGLAGVVINPSPPNIPVDENSQTPLYFGINASGFVLSSNPADATTVAFGVDANGHPYVKGGTT